MCQALVKCLAHHYPEIICHDLLWLFGLVMLNLDQR